MEDLLPYNLTLTQNEDIIIDSHVQESNQLGCLRVLDNINRV